MLGYRAFPFIVYGFVAIIIIALFLSTRYKFTYTKYFSRCLKCGCYYESRYNSVVDLVMFLHRIVCRRN